MKRVGIYLRVSTDQQTTENQRRVLLDIADRSGWEVVAIFEDQGISGTKGRDQRPAFDALLKAVARSEVQMVVAWSVDRLGRSLSDLLTFLGDLQAKGCDLYLHQQAIDTSTPSGRMLFQLLGVFAEFERSMIGSRVRAGQARARARGVTFGRPTLGCDRVARVEQALARGDLSIRQIAKQTKVSTATVQRVKKAMATPRETIAA